VDAEEADQEQQGAAARRVARNAAIRAVGEVIAKVGSLAFYIACARELGESGFGDFSFAVSFTTVLFLAAGFGTEELVAREVARDRDRVHNYLTNVVALKALLSIAMALVAVAVMTIADYPDHVRYAVYIVGFGVCVESFGRTWGSVFQAYERMEFISLTLILQRILTAIAGLIVLSAGGGLIGVSVVFAVTAVIAFAVGTWTLRRYVVAPRWVVDRSRWWPLVKAGLPIGIVSLLSVTLLKLDQVLLSFMSGGDNREVGLYGAAFRLIEATLFISWSFSAAMLPWLSRQAHGQPARLLGGFELGEKALVAVLLPIAIVFVLLAHPLIELVYGSQYEDSIASLQLLGAVTVFVGINEFAAMVLIARDKPGTSTRLLAVATLVNLITNLILIPPLGATGAALAALSSGVLLAVMGIVILRVELGPIRLLRPYAGPAVAGAAMAIVIVATGQSLVVGALAGGAAYALTLILFERVVFPDDFDVFAGLVRRRGRGGAGPTVPEGA
jgi:O-antigen/teichoic acid export membrane protein